MAGTIKGIIVEISGDTSDLQKALSKVNSQSSSLSKELRGINSLLKLDPKSTELLAQKQTVLNENIETTKDKLNQLKKVKEEADKKMSEGTEISEDNYRALQREIINTERKLNNLTEDLKQFNLENSKWTKAGKLAEEYGNKITKIGEKIDQAGNKMSVVSAGVVAGGTAMVTSAMGAEDAVSKYISTTNTAAEETEKYRQVLEDISNDNYGESYEDIADSMSQVKMQLKNINDFDLKNITEKAMALRDMFGYDVSESIRAVKALMDNFNISADEAFNLIAEGKKQGLDFSNEMLDNVNEYSVQFKKLGLTAEDMFNIFKTGADNGAFNLDKIGDAVKEFSIRAIDGSNTTVEGFKKIGLNANEMAKKFASGGDTAKKAFTEVIQKIGKMDNKVEQSIVGVDLFGTMWEDLGPTVITSFDKMDNGISKSNDSMQKSIDELYNTTKKKAEAQLKRLKGLGADFGEEMLPTLEKLIDKAEGFVSSLENMSDEEKENIVKIAMLVAGMGPLTKVVGTAEKVFGTTTKGIGIFSQAIGVAKNKTESTSASVNNLAKILMGLSSPAGLTAIGITGAVGIILTQIKKAEEETKTSFSNMGTGASEFIRGIDSATSHLDSFNSTLFASSEEQQKLQEDMNNVQKGITDICKKASNERRGYTQEEITQLDKYFEKLRELKNRELEIQKSISSSITQQSEQNARSFQGSLEEYKVNSQEWIKTAQEQANKEIAIINDRTTQEIALLQQRYGEKAEMENEEYAREYNAIQENKDKAIQEANDEVAKVNLAYSNGYLQRSQQEDSWYSKYSELNGRLEEAKNKHLKTLEEIDNNFQLSEDGKRQQKIVSESNYNDKIKRIWKDMYKNMSDSEEEQLGIWIGMITQTELYGGKIDDETQKIVDNILNSYDNMPKGTQEAMKNAMQPMLEEMEKKEPSLYAKAEGIAGGILGRLKKAFDIHSPSKKTREIFQNVMASPEEEMEKGRKVLENQAKRIATDVLRNFEGISLGSKIRMTDKSIIERNNTIFTTPQIVFNVQELDEAKLQQCFNYINKKFGSAY